MTKYRIAVSVVLGAAAFATVVCVWAITVAASFDAWGTVTILAVPLALLLNVVCSRARELWELRS